MHPSVVPVVSRPDYCLGYERAAGVTFIHCDVRRWTHHIARSIRRDLETAHELLGEPLYALQIPDDDLHKHFLITHGFHPHSVYTNAESRAVQIYRRTLDG